MSFHAPATVRRSLFGVPIDALTMRETVARVEAAIDARRSLLIGVVNAAKIVNMQRDAALRASVLASDLILADGMAVVWAARLLGRPLPERVAGIDLMLEMLARGDECGWRVFCLGAKADVLARFAQRVAERHPRLNLVGCRHGYYKSDEEPDVAREIGAARPDILLVAMTSPRKEQFLARWHTVIGNVVSHGVGGSFDVVAGMVKRAPPLWQRCGMEWLYRVWQEPGRLWKRYLVTNVMFCWMLLAALVARLLGARPTPAIGADPAPRRAPSARNP